MTDKEMMELAAKAAGVTIKYNYIGTQDARCPWNPLNEDGDRYRLIKTLKINIDFSDQCAWKRMPNGDLIQEFWHEEGDYADPSLGDEAHAVLRAAAEIGKAMP
jgi:hypothetical protein